MGLTSLLLAIFGVIACFLGPAGMIFSIPLAVIALIFGILGIRRKQNTGIAGTVISSLIIVVMVPLLIYVNAHLATPIF